MPKTSKQLPQDGTPVRFRADGDTKLWHGTYTDEKGFEVCNGFLCFSMELVNYWQPEVTK